MPRIFLTLGLATAMAVPVTTLIAVIAIEDRLFDVAAESEPPRPMVTGTPSARSEPDELEPEITIVHQGKQVHEEYRIHGRLYMIKVYPAKGPPYYLIDYEGRGRYRRSDLEPTIAIPNWVIRRF
jgi:hypothetical protein